ncbi:MAG: antibiotic biosynthesis monooxygenase [Pseudomonadota bacterium]
MFAEVGRNTLDPSRMPNVEVLQELQALLAKQPGYRGYLAIEGQDHQRIFVRIWDTEAAAKAASQSEELKRFSEHHISPSVAEREVIGRGQLLHSDLVQLFKAEAQRGDHL